LTRSLSPFKALAVFFIVFSALVFCGCEPNRKFSVESWKQASPKERYWMADDFLQSVETKGMTIDELKSLLGEPDYAQKTLVYYLDDKVSPLTQAHDLSSYYRPVLLVFFTKGVVTYTRCQTGDTNAEKPFEAAQWQTATPAQRSQMCGNMLDLKGMTEAEVIEILGEADETEANYYLGYRGLDTQTLTFILNRDGKTICAENIEH
jgi:hypothetical protein